MELGEALELIDRSRELLSKESNILHIQVRCFARSFKCPHPAFR